MNHMEILYQQAADGDSHPAVLVAVVVDRASLADLPTDGDQFVERIFVDQVAGVVLAIPGQIGGQRVGAERGVLEESAELLGFVERGLGELAELGYEILDWDLVYCGGHGLLPKKYNAAEVGLTARKPLTQGSLGNTG